MQQSGFGGMKSLSRHAGGMPQVCPTRQPSIGDGASRGETLGPAEERSSMYYVAAALLVLSGLFYSASHHELGQFGTNMCSYGSAFCDNPLIVFSGAALAAAWGMFVSIK
jgi:hypothetical protein